MEEKEAEVELLRQQLRALQSPERAAPVSLNSGPPL